MSRLAKIQTEWETDAKLDRTELGTESIKIPKLHSKYWNAFCCERKVLRGIEADFNVLFRDLHAYYSGVLDQETMQQRRWSPNPLKILRTDVEMYINGNEDFIAKKKELEDQKDVVRFLEDIIKSLTNRGYNIRTALEWERFMNGA